MVRVLRIVIIASVAALTAVSVVLVVNAGYIIPATPPVIQSIHVIEAPRPIPPEPERRPEPVTEHEPEELKVLCMPLEEPGPRYPYLEPEWYAEMEKRLEKRISVRFEDTPINEAFAIVSDLLEVSIVLSPDVDTELPISLRLRNVKAKHALALMFAAYGDLGHRLRPEGIIVSCDPVPTVREQIRDAIAEARAEMRAQRRMRQFREALNSPVENEFHWTGKTCREALLEVCTAWSLPLNVQSCEDFYLYLNAPRGRWKGNVKDALERALEGTDLSYAFNPDGNTMNIMREEAAKLHLYNASMRGSAFNRLKSAKLSFNPAGMKLNEIIKRIENDIGIFVVPDKETWDKHITLAFDRASPTLGELLDYLQRNHIVSAWLTEEFMVSSYDCDSALVLFSPDKGNSLLCSSGE